MTRARFVMGTPELEGRFDAVRTAVITSPRDPMALREEIVSMRAKVAQAHPTRDGQFDVKHSPGGMIDVEFAVQYLVLAHSHRHAGLLDNVGNIALLQHAEDVGLLPAGAGSAAGKAYRELRRLQHRARLNESPTRLEGEALVAIEPHRQAVLTLWASAFPAAAAPGA